MNHHFLAVFLTFVVAISTSAWAKPHADAPKDTAPLTTEDEITPESLDGFVVSPTKATSVEEYSKKFSRADYFHNYKKAITLRAGAVFGFQDSSDDEDLTNAVFGFQFLMPRKKMPQIEVGADLSTVGHGHFTLMAREIFNHRGSFRPYYGYGMMHKLDPDDKSGSFADFENYLGRLSVGFENSTRRSRSWRFEVELAVGAKDTLGFITLGHVFSF